VQAFTTDGMNDIGEGSFNRPHQFQAARVREKIQLEFGFLKKGKRIRREIEWDCPGGE